MLTNIKINNFKSLIDLDLRCAPLTLLTGMNGAGKSSVFQALLMLRQTFQSGGLEAGQATLNGPYISLNTDIHRTQSSIVDLELMHTDVRRPCEISLSAGSPYRPRRDWNDPDAHGPWVVREPPTRTSIPDDWRDVPPLGGDLVYVSADRSGPLVSYARSDLNAQNKDLGTRGEFVINYLSNTGVGDLPQRDIRALGEYLSLSDTVDYWLGEISPGATLKIEDWEDDKPISAYFSFDGSIGSGFPAVNVGFGLTHCLPVIVALLMPRSTQCLIENPEAHLHPRGQSTLAELAARAVKSGVQVFVETHSDHFIDGIRVAVREGVLSPNEVVFHYFERQGDETTVTSPVIDSDGRLSEWPAGFFDQHEMNLVRLLRPIQGS